MSDYRPEIKKIALNNMKLGLRVPCPTAEGKFSSLSWGLNKNNPYIRVYTGDPADENERTKNGRIQAELDLPHMYLIFQLIRTAVSKENGWKNCLEIKNFIFPGGKKSEKPVNTCDIWVGKDKEGCVYISLIDKLIKDRPVIKFDIAMNGYWMNLKHGDGQPYTKVETSTMFALGYATYLEEVYAHLSVTEFVPYESKSKDAGKGGYSRGGNNQRFGGGNNYNNRNNESSSSNDEDDEIPF